MVRFTLSEDQNVQIWGGAGMPVVPRTTDFLAFFLFVHAARLIRECSREFCGCVVKKNLAIANRSRISYAHNTSTA